MEEREIDVRFTGEIDDEIRAYAKSFKGDYGVTGWLLAIASTPPDSDGSEVAYDLIVPANQAVHLTAGLIRATASHPQHRRAQEFVERIGRCLADYVIADGYYATTWALVAGTVDKDRVSRIWRFFKPDQPKFVNDGLMHTATVVIDRRIAVRDDGEED